LLTDGVNAVLQRALAKHESDRYGSCEEFITDLKSGTPALLDTSGYHISESVSRPAAEKVLTFAHRDTSRRWLIVISVLLVFILGAIVWGLNSRSKTLSGTNSVQRQDNANFFREDELNTDNPFEDPTARKADKVERKKVEQQPPVQRNGNDTTPSGYSQHDWNKVKTAKDSNGLRDNQVTWTEVRGIKRLTRIDAAGNNDRRGNLIGALDLSGCNALNFLNCEYNGLDSLNVSGCTDLKFLRCDNNKLTMLDVSKNIYLEGLWCWRNQLTTLDISANLALKELDYGWNKITTALDTSQHKDLILLGCAGLQLTTLNISENTKLEYLICWNNQLTTLDVDKNMNLTELRCQNNQLTTLTVSASQSFDTLDHSGNPQMTLVTVR
jgi:hypothetical protein